MGEALSHYLMPDDELDLDIRIDVARRRSAVEEGVRVERLPLGTEDLLQMTEESLYADWQENRAFVRGVGRVVQNTTQNRLLARRVALTDARRGLPSWLDIRIPPPA